MREYRVADLDSMPDRETIIVRADEGFEIGVFRINGKIYAFENRCRHQGGPVCYGEVLGNVEVELAEDGSVVREYVNEEKLYLVCPWHGWEYDLETGTCGADPNIRLRKFDTVVRDGAVYVVVK